MPCVLKTLKFPFMIPKHSDVLVNPVRDAEILLGSRYLFRFEDTDGFMIRFEVVGFSGGQVELLALDWPHLSRTITLEQFRKGLVFMSKKMKEMDPLTACLLLNMVTIDGFTST